ncbi:MAG: MBL fold metallo-hydrolase [Gammaproteobacteria bacterium]|nr:MBL fold metallo-hydrolase [Gammaproteobacteria bacterium]
MNIGFDTIGNAILICYDQGRPVLATDPWIAGSAYFGSWGFSHEIPEQQMSAIKAADHIWLSHGHPDHLSSASMELLRDRKILLPDHVGERIYQGLKEQGYDVHTLRDREWYQLSPHVRALCISDFNQDAVLLVDINGRLVFNRNDASDHGWESFVRNIIKKYDISFLLALSSRFGDADMINYFDEDGNRIPVRENVPSLGARNAHRTETVGARYFIPFSSMHGYQREDSAWANQYHTSLADYATGFKSERCELLPAFIRYDCERDLCEEIKPAELPHTLFSPADFGDDWSETLERPEVEMAGRYFGSIQHLSRFLDFINLRVGGQDNIIRLNPKREVRGVTFEAPRHSLMTAIKYEIFDDLLIGNFMKTTLHGNWSPGRLYPDFTPYVAKYADNGRAKSDQELADYFKAYRKRAVLDFLKFQFEKKAEAIYRSYVAEGSLAHRVAKKAYWVYKKSLR